MKIWVARGNCPKTFCKMQDNTPNILVLYVVYFFSCLFSGWRGKQKKPTDERHGSTSITGKGGPMLSDFSLSSQKAVMINKPVVKWFYFVEYSFHFLSTNNTSVGMWF